jgi:hypothetical protein
MQESGDATCLLACWVLQLNKAHAVVERLIYTGLYSSSSDDNTRDGGGASRVLTTARFLPTRVASDVHGASHIKLECNWLWSHDRLPIN